MRRLLKALGLVLGLSLPVLAGPSSPPAGNFILNVSTTLNQPAFNVSSGTVSSTFFLPFLTAGQCITVNSSGKTIGIACGSGSSSVAVTTGNASGFSSIISSPTAVINFDSSTFNLALKGAATVYVLPNPSSVTLQGNNLSATYLTNSSATATYLQLSSATATYLTVSSASATYFNLNNILGIVHGGTGTSSPGLIAGTNIGSITGSWPNQTINASSTLVTSTASVTTGHCAQFSAATGIIDSGNGCGSGGGGSGGSSSLQVTQSGIQITSPTASINFTGPPFSLTAVGSTSTITLDPSSATLQGNSISLSALSSSMTVVGIATGTLTTRLIAVGVSTAAIAVDTGTINTALSTKVNYSSFSATLPITFNSGTGAIGATQISLSTGTMNILPSAQMVSTAAFTTSSQTYSGQNSWITPAQSTFTYGLTAGSITVNGAGAGAVQFTEGTDSSVFLPAINKDNFWASSSSHTFVFNPNGGVSTYTVVGSSINPTIGHLATWSGLGTVIDGGVVPVSGGGGASSLEVLAGVNRTSPTVTVGFPGPPFIGTVTGSSMTVTLDPSSVTLQGQNVVNLTSVLQSGATFYVSSGTVNGTFTTSGTIQTNNFSPTGFFEDPANIIINRTPGSNGCIRWTDGVNKDWQMCNNVNDLGIGFGSVTGSMASFIDFSTSGSYPFGSTVTIGTSQFNYANAITSGQQTWTSPKPSSFTYQVNIGSITGGGLATCGDATHALAYTSTSTFACQNVTGSAGGSGGLVSLSTGVFQILPTNLMVSTVAYTTSTQTFTGGQTITSGTITNLVVLTSAVIPSLSQNFGRATLNQWFSQMASIQSPFSPLNGNKLSIVILGDSHMAKNVETGPFIDWLYSNFGNGGTYFPLSDNGESDNTMRPNGCTYSKSGSWVTNQNSPTALGLDDDSMHSSTPTATILGTCPQADTVIMHYTKQPNGGTVDFSVDGANHMVLNTANGTTVVASATISGLSYGVHTASVSLVSPSGTAGIDVLDWVFFSSSTPGAVVYRAGSNAQRADMYTAQNATQYQNLVAMLPSTPSVVLVALDVNDAASAVVPGTFVSNVETIVQRFRNVYPNIDCAYQSEPDFQNSASDLFPLSAYETGLLQASVRDACAFVDFTAYFSTFPAFSQYYSDTIHLNKQGGQVAAQLFINTFSNNVNTIDPFTYNASSNVVTWGTDITTTSVSNFTSLGSNIQTSSGITNAGAIGTNLTVTKSNTFLIGGAAGSGAEQTLTVATMTASASSITGASGESVTFGLGAGSVTARNVNGVTQCLHANAAGLITGTGADCLGGGSVINNFQPGWLQMAHGHNFTYGVNSTTYMVVGNASLEQLSVEAEAQMPFSSSGTLRGLWVMVNANSLTSGSTVTLRINGQNASEQVFIPAGQIGEFQDTAHMDFINVGDKVDYQLQTGSIGTSLLLYGMAVVFSPTQNNVMKMVSTGQPYGNTTNGLATYYHTITGLLDMGNIYESTVSYRTKTAGTFANLTVDVSSNSRPGATVVRFRKNGSNGNEVVTIPALSSGTYTDSVNVDNVVVGDTVDYQTTMDGNVSVAGSSVVWIGSEFTTTGNQVDYVAPTLGHFFNPGDANIWPILSYGGSDSAEVNSFQAKSQVGMVCSNLHVYLSSNSLNQPITIFFRKNQANGNQTLVIPAGSWGYFEDTFSTHTDIVSPGDEIDWKDTVPAGSGTAPFNYIAMTCKILQNPPSGANTQVAFNDNGTLGGSSGFTFNKSSGNVAVTYGVVAGTFTSSALDSILINGTPSQSLDVRGGLLDVFKTNASGGGGDLLIGIGTNQQADQIQIKDQTPLGLTRYGANIGGLQIGLAAGTQKVGTNQTANNFLEVYNGGNMNLSTDVGANNDIVMKPGATENVRVSNTSGMTVTSSETNKSTGGLQLRAGPLSILSQAAPAQTDGYLWLDSTQQSMRADVSGTSQSVSGILWTMTTSSSVFNTATETAAISTATIRGVGTLNIPANFFVAGKTLYIVLAGTYTTTGTPTLDLKVKIGGTTVLDSGVVTLTTVTGTDVLTLSAHLTCRSTGASGTVMGVGQTVQNTSTIATAGMDLNSTLTTIDTTRVQPISVTVTWGAASASNNLTFTNGFVNILN